MMEPRCGMPLPSLIRLSSKSQMMYPMLSCSLDLEYLMNPVRSKTIEAGDTSDGLLLLTNGLMLAALEFKNTSHRLNHSKNLRISLECN
jgi:hypothetical protein